MDSLAYFLMGLLVVVSYGGIVPLIKPSLSPIRFNGKVPSRLVVLGLWLGSAFIIFFIIAVFLVLAGDLGKTEISNSQSLLLLFGMVCSIVFWIWRIKSYNNGTQNLKPDFKPQMDKSKKQSTWQNFKEDNRSQKQKEFDRKKSFKHAEQVAAKLGTRSQTDLKESLKLKHAEKLKACSQVKSLKIQPSKFDGIGKRQLVLDVETTGFSHANGDRVIEIGIWELVDSVMTDSFFHVYLNPQCPVGQSRKVHGHTDEFLANKPLFSEIGHELAAYINGAEIIAHNATFDINFLDSEFKRLGITPLKDSVSVIDTVKLAKKQYPDQKNSLDALIERFHLTPRSEFHGALSDARILVDVYLILTGISVVQEMPYQDVEIEPVFTSGYSSGFLGIELEIFYEGADGFMTVRTIDVMNIYTEKKRWYIDAYCRNKLEERTFRADRIQELTNFKTGEYLSNQTAIRAYIRDLAKNRF